MRRAATFALGLLAAPPLFAQGPVIDHAGVGCIVAGRHPRIEARVSPAEGVARARVYFRASGTSAWYYVLMKPAAGVLQGALPKPAKATRSIDYYVEAVDSAFREARTAEFKPSVVEQGASCPGGLPAATALATASVTVGAAAGAPAVPAGFAKAGIVGIGGGLSTGAVVAVVGGGAAVAGGVAVASRAGGSDDGNGSDSGFRSPQYDITFSSPGIDVSVCAGRPLTYCCQNVHAAADGTFNETWSPSEPNTIRIQGRVDASRFEATLTCASRAGPTGSISASGNGSSYSGTFSFGTSQGSVAITRQP